MYVNKNKSIIIFSQTSVILFTGGGVVSQHALQVVSQHVLQQVSRGGWYPSMPCRFQSPHPGGKFRGIWLGGSPGPYPRGKLRGISPGRGGLQAYTQGGSAPGGGLLLGV